MKSALDPQVSFNPMAAFGRLAALGAALAAYSLYEPTRYRLEKKVVPYARPVPELSILHVSDTHLRASDRLLRSFLAELPDRLGSVPDLVVATGDFIDDNSGIEPAVDALAQLEAKLGRFYVLGSHDYYQSSGRNLSKYFTGDHQVKTTMPAATAELERGLQDKGWISLLNAGHVVSTPQGPIRVFGVDDPYIDRHDASQIERAPGEVFALGLVHCPNVVSEWVLEGFDLVLAGHTHGGQVRVPGIGALVTNSSLPAALAAGLHAVGHSWLHVSRGLGTSHYSRIRFWCPPEVSLLEVRSQR